MRKTNGKASILLIEDDPIVAESLKRLLNEHYQVETAATAEDGLARAETCDFHVVVTDLHMPGISGLDFIKALHPAKPNLPIVLMTAHHTTDTAIEATKSGAYDYVLKPIIDLEAFFKVIENAVATRALTAKPVAMGEDKVAHDAIIGRSRAMQHVYGEIGRVAARPVTVFVRGETGTGKELVARAVYQHSDRLDRPFIIVNCVAIPETLLESELFGHEQGAFTGAHTLRIGKFEQANHGTIFLDEIGDMSVGTQAKLLRVLQERVIQRVGGNETIRVDVRVIAATHRDLEQAVQGKTFREDLYYRLNDAVIRLPALRERREDIPDLVHYFLHQQETGSPVQPGITDEALRLLQYRSWPGNVRELRNTIHKAVLLAGGFPIDPGIIRRALDQTSTARTETKRTLQAYVSELLEGAERDAQTNVAAAVTEWAERELYGQAILLAEGDQTKVANWLGVSRPTVRERLRRFGVHPGSDRSATNEMTG
jgi:DNA-binding NtrC family response regulator